MKRSFIVSYNEGKFPEFDRWIVYVVEGPVNAPSVVAQIGEVVNNVALIATDESGTTADFVTLGLAVGWVMDQRAKKARA